MNLNFSRFANLTAKFTGSSRTFAACCLIIVIWALSGPVFNFSDTWQLFINTGTTIITFLMIFLLQNSQNRDMAALQVKLDEILRAIPAARNTIVAIDIDSDEDKIKEVREEVKGEALHGR